MLDDLVLCGTLIIFPLYLFIFCRSLDYISAYLYKRKSLIKQPKPPFDQSLTNISASFCTYLCECRRESLNNSAALRRIRALYAQGKVIKEVMISECGWKMSGTSSLPQINCSLYSQVIIQSPLKTLRCKAKEWTMGYTWCCIDIQCCHVVFSEKSAQKWFFQQQQLLSHLTFSKAG